MTDVKRLLKEATPLPWQWLIDSYEPAKVFITDDPNELQDPIVEQIEQADAALIVHAVNSLPAYEAAVEALERIVALFDGSYIYGKRSKTFEQAREALRRLREEVPA